MEGAMKSVKRSWKKKEEEEEGVYVIASTFTSLKVLVQCLTSPEVDIPVSALGLGPVSTGDIRKACKLLERKPQVMAFKVEVTPEASQLAEALGVKIISGDSIEDMCQQFKEECIKQLGEKEEEAGSDSDEEVSTCALHLTQVCAQQGRPNCRGSHCCGGFSSGRDSLMRSIQRFFEYRTGCMD